MDLRGKRIALTGGSAGIGRALALALAKRGARLALGARDFTALEGVAAECRALGGDAHPIAVDVIDKEACARFVRDSVRALGGLDALVNNAGVSMLARFEDVADLALFERVLRVNYLGAVYCTAAALPELKRNGGLLVAISSLTGLVGVPTRSAYAASKHALQGFFDSLRMELLGSGVGVLVVSPGFVDTEMRKHAFGGDGQALGHDPRAGRRAMSAERCAELVATAMQRRKRELVLGAGRALQALNLVWPALADRLVAFEMRQR